jgi:hypothetical protein
MNIRSLRLALTSTGHFFLNLPRGADLKLVISPSWDSWDVTECNRVTIQHVVKIVKKTTNNYLQTQKCWMVQGEDSDEIRVMDQTQKFATSHWNMTDITQNDNCLWLVKSRCSPTTVIFSNKSCGY